MERETLEMDVVFVGGGPANLSGALHLARLMATHNEAVANRKAARACSRRNRDRRHRERAPLSERISCPGQ